MKQFRTCTFEVRQNEGADTPRVRVSVSSETPCPMYVTDPDTGATVYAMEILGHGDGEIDMTRCAEGLVIQDNHGGDQIGLIRKVEVSGGKLGGSVDFCSGPRAKEIEADALAGLRRNMSVGYMVNAWQRVEGEIDGLPVYRATSWTPFEASFVNVPADVQVGVNRELGAGESKPVAQAATTETKESAMDDDVKDTAAETPAAVEEKLSAISKKLDEITDYITTPKEDPPKKEEEKPAMPTPEAKAMFDAGDTKKIARSYNLMNVIRSMTKGGERTDVGFEREISDEIGRKTGRSAQGFFIPDAVFTRTAWGKGNGGANLVATDTLFSEMVPALVAECVLGKLGVRTLTGLVGDVAIPKAGSVTGYWVNAEGGSATEQTPSIGQITSTPKTVGAYVDITRKLMNQSGISAQAFVSDALRSALARCIETAAFSGAGTSGAPTGLDNASISQITSFTTPTLEKVLSFISTIEADNAAGPDMKFCGRPGVWATLASTLDWKAVTASDANVGGVTSGKYLLDAGTNTCQGYPFVKANLATASRLYFGDWSKLMLAFWSGLDLKVDENSLSQSGGIRIVALQDMDVITLQPKAFAYGSLV